MSIPAWVVTAVSPSADYSLYLTFADGTKRVYNAAPLLEKPLFASFRNPAFFMTARGMRNRCLGRRYRYRAGASL